jgi:hypothetical protein
MNTYSQELVWVTRNAQGDITRVYEPNPSKYYKVVDIAIRIDPSESESVEESIKEYAKRKRGIG